jgi:hypothetical protein
VQILRQIISGIVVAEEWYLEEYPDIAQAIREGKVESAKQHFIDDGFFEGRRPFPMDVDERWYLQQYPDVAESIRTGVVGSGQQHFAEDGYREGRLPYALYDVRHASGFPYRRTGLPVPIDRNARPDRDIAMVCGETLVDTRLRYYGTRDTIGASAHA